MMKPMETETIIWEGRFQPVHLGHIGYIRHLLSRGSPVWIHLVDSETSRSVPDVESPVPSFSEVVSGFGLTERFGAP